MSQCLWQCSRIWSTDSSSTRHIGQLDSELPKISLRTNILRVLIRLMIAIQQKISTLGETIPFQIPAKEKALFVEVTCCKIWCLFYFSSISNSCWTSIFIKNKICSNNLILWIPMFCWSILSVRKISIVWTSKILSATKDFRKQTLINNCLTCFW